MLEPNNEQQQPEIGRPDHLISPISMSEESRARFTAEVAEGSPKQELPEGAVVIDISDAKKYLTAVGLILSVGAILGTGVTATQTVVGREFLANVGDIFLARRRRDDDTQHLQIYPTVDANQYRAGKLRDITDRTNAGTQAKYNTLLASAVGGVRTDNSAETALDTTFTKALETARAQINEQLRAELAALYEQHGNLLTPISPDTPIEVQGKQSFSWLSFMAGNSDQLRSLPDYLQAQAACDQIITEFFSKDSPEPNAWLDFISTDLKRYGINKNRQSLRELMLTELKNVITPEGNTQTAGLFELGQLPAIQEHVKNGGNLLNVNFAHSEYRDVFGSYHPSSNTVHQFTFHVGNHEEAPDNLRYNSTTKMLVVMVKDGTKTILLSGRWDCGLNMHVDVFEEELPTPTFTPTNTPTSFDTVTLTPTPGNTSTATPTPTPSDTPITVDTGTPTSTPNETTTPTNTATSVDTSTPTLTFTPTPTVTPTNTPLPPKDTPTALPTDTPRPTATNESTSIPTPTNTQQPAKTDTPVLQPTNTPQPPPSGPTYTPVPDGGSTPAPPGPPPSSRKFEGTDSYATIQTAEANIQFINALSKARAVKRDGKLPTIKGNVNVKVGLENGQVVSSTDALREYRNELRPLNEKLGDKTISAHEESRRFELITTIKMVKDVEKKYAIYLSDFEAYAWNLSNGNMTTYNQLLNAAQDSLHL